MKILRVAVVILALPWSVALAQCPEGVGPAVPWQRYVDQRFADLRNQLAAQRDADQLAVRVYSESNQRALEKVNEFRASLNDQNTRFATTEGQKTLEAQINANSGRISLLEQSRSKLEGQSEQVAANARSSIAWVGLGLVVLQIAMAIALRLMWK